VERGIEIGHGLVMRDSQRIQFGVLMAAQAEGRDQLDDCCLFAVGELTVAGADEPAQLAELFLNVEPAGLGAGVTAQAGKQFSPVLGHEARVLQPILVQRLDV